jgi:threonine/homoserine/homoserine lactone efflux protein
MRYSIEQSCRLLTVPTSSLASYVLVTLMLVITPGATTAIVVRNTINSGWRLGAATALGAALANSTHAAAAGIGLALLFKRWPMALVVLRWAGAFYLAGLAISSLRRSITSAASLETRLHTGRSRGHNAAFSQGLTVNLLNPPIIVFYLVVVPTFVPAGAGLAGFAPLAAIHVTMAFACHLGWALLFDRMRRFLRRPGWLQMLEGGAGAALLYLAVRTVLRS